MKRAVFKRGGPLVRAVVFLALAAVLFCLTLGAFLLFRRIVPKAAGEEAQAEP